MTRPEQNLVFHWFLKWKLLISKKNKLRVIIPIVNWNLYVKKLSKLSTYNDHMRYLLTSGSWSGVIYIMKVHPGTSKWWPLQAGGHYSELDASSGLTVNAYYNEYIILRAYDNQDQDYFKRI